MKKSHAHIVLLFFDAAAVLAVRHVVTETSDLLSHHAGSADKVTVDSSTPYLLLLAVAPIFHMCGVLERFNILSQRAIRALDYWFPVAMALLLVSAAYLTGGRIEQHLQDVGYAYCEATSKRGGLFVKMRDYVKGPEAIACPSLESPRYFRPHAAPQRDNRRDSWLR